MKRNYSDLINSKEKRILSAKGYKFLQRCIELSCKNKGLNRYSKEYKPTKEKLTKIIHHLIIDKEMTIEEIKNEFQKSRAIETN